MSNELVINSTQEGCRIALLRDKSLVEFHQEVDTNKFTVGDIYLGTVRKVVPGLNAAFIDVGYEKDAFLHYLDLGPQIRTLNKHIKGVLAKKSNGQPIGKIDAEPDIDKLGKINQVLNRNQSVLVQIVKEPISTKGPRLSCELSLAGRYLILVPFSSVVNISKKITDKAERKRLSRLVSSIKPEGFGVIIRTVASGKDVAELDRDLRNLVKSWQDGMKKLQNAKPRDKIIGEMGRASALLRDVLNESFDSIVTDDDSIFSEVKSYIRKIAPNKEKIVKHYHGKTKLFENYGIEKQLKSLFGQSVSVPGGGYLIIEHTEALHVVDVNSGNKSNSEKDQEATALNVNLQAVSEIARQLRLRDMGGIIVVDFIDMRNSDNKKAVYQKMKEVMKSERAKHTILPLTKFGFMQIARPRVRPELNIVTKEICPSCGGTGKITPSILVADQIERDIDYLLSKQNEKALTLALHPYLEAYFTKGFISKRMDWFFKYKKWIRLEVDSSLGMMDYHFYNRNGEQIELPKA
ncbi:MAG: ribonuclease E/G [Cyclobacteriaceae bacterium]